MRAAYARTHVLLLPSSGEGAAIAPAEAAHFGRPSVVSDAGGLPTVVLDRRTGRVLRQAATVDDYADAVEEIVSDRDTYLSYCRAALDRAQRVFTWDAWGRSVAALLEGAVEERRLQRP